MDPRTSSPDDSKDFVDFKQSLYALVATNPSIPLTDALSTPLEQMQKAEYQEELDGYKDTVNENIARYRPKGIVALATAFNNTIMSTPGGQTPNKENATRCKAALEKYLEELDLLKLDDGKKQLITEFKAELSKHNVEHVYQQIHDSSLTSTVAISLLTRATDIHHEIEQHYDGYMSRLAKFKDCEAKFKSFYNNRHKSIPTGAERFKKNAGEALGALGGDLPVVGTAVSAIATVYELQGNVDARYQHAPLWKRTLQGLKNMAGATYQAFKDFIKENPKLSIAGGIAAAVAGGVIGFVFPPAWIAAALGVGAAVVGAGLTIKKLFGIGQAETARSARMNERLDAVESALENEREVSRRPLLDRRTAATPSSHPHESTSHMFGSLHITPASPTASNVSSDAPSPASSLGSSGPATPSSQPSASTPTSQSGPAIELTETQRHSELQAQLAQMRLEALTQQRNESKNDGSPPNNNSTPQQRR